MKKRAVLMFAVLVLVIGLSSCGLFMPDETRDLIGLWSYEDAGGSTSYFDFRANGRVFLTEFESYFAVYNYWIMPFPVSFYYRISDNELILSQYMGISHIDFETASDFSGDVIVLNVLTETDSSLDFSRGDTLTLTRIIDFTDERNAAVQAYLQEFGNE